MRPLNPWIDHPRMLDGFIPQVIFFDMDVA